MPKMRDVYEVIVTDARDSDSTQPESSSGLLFSEKDARQALAEIQADGQVTSWCILKNGVVIDNG